MGVGVGQRLGVVSTCVCVCVCVANQTNNNNNNIHTHAQTLTVGEEAAALACCHPSSLSPSPYLSPYLYEGRGSGL